MEKEFIITVFSENKVGLLSQITTVFTHRNVNIESLTASESAVDGVHKYTIIVKNDEEKVANLVKQIEKKIDVLKVFCYSPSEVVLQQVALYKVQRGRNVEDLVRRHNVRILDIHDDFIVLEKTGHKAEIQELYHSLAIPVIAFVVFMNAPSKHSLEILFGHQPFDNTRLDVRQRQLLLLLSFLFNNNRLVLINNHLRIGISFFDRGSRHYDVSPKIISRPIRVVVHFSSKAIASVEIVFNHLRNAVITIILVFPFNRNGRD